MDRSVGDSEAEDVDRVRIVMALEVLYDSGQDDTGSLASSLVELLGEWAPVGESGCVTSLDVDMHPNVTGP